MVYLNCAALCPTRPEAEHEVESTLAEFKQLLYSDTGLKWYERKVAHCRQQLAAFLNLVDPSHIAFSSSASMAFHLIVSSLNWKQGDSILSLTHENPSIRQELQKLSNKGVKVNYLRPTSPHDLINAIDQFSLSNQSLKAIVMSHVSHVDGRIFPVQEIGTLARERNLLFIVDGAQAVGHIPVDLQQFEFDFYFFPGHKWCCGPLGTGALALHEHFLSAYQSLGLADFQSGKSSHRNFEIGTHNIGLIAGLAKACEIKHREGLKTQHLWNLRETVKSKLGESKDVFQIKEWDGYHAPGILTVRLLPNVESQRLLNQFESSDIVVKIFKDYPDGECPAIRISWSFKTSEEDVEYLIKNAREFSAL